MAEPLKAQRKTYTAAAIPADTDRVVFLGSGILDNIHSTLTALSMEVWVQRRRMYVVESLLARHGAVTREMIDRYVPSEEEAADLKRERDQFVRTIFDPMTRRTDMFFSTSKTSL